MKKSDKSTLRLVEYFFVGGILKGLMLYYEYKIKRLEVENWNLKKTIEEMMQKDYKTFVTALISIEKDINNQEVLDMMYQKYMNTDEMHLLNDKFDEMIEAVHI